MAYDQRYQQAQAQLARGKSKDAAETFDKAAAEAMTLSQRADATQQAATAYLGAEQLERARETNRVALVYATEQAANWQQRAAIMQRLGQPSLAQEAANEAVLPCISLADWLRRTRALYHAQLFMPAYSAAQRVLQQDPQNVEALQWRVLIARQFYDPVTFVEAQEAFAAIAGHQNFDRKTGAPVHPDARALYAQVDAVIRAEQYQEAAALIERVLAIEPRYFEALVQQALLLVAVFNQPERAMQVLDLAESSLTVPICDIDFFTTRAHAALLLQQNRVAIRVLAQGLHRYPVGQWSGKLWSIMNDALNGVTRSFLKGTMESVARKRLNAVMNQSASMRDVPLLYPNSTWADALFRVEHELKAMTSERITLWGKGPLIFSASSDPNDTYYFSPHDLPCGLINVVGLADIAEPILLVRVEIRPQIIASTAPVTAAFSLMYTPVFADSLDTLKRMIASQIGSMLNHIMDSSQRY